MKKASNNKDYYSILRVPPTADFNQVKSSYRRLVKEHHPDKYLTYVQKLWATKKMQDINEAYAILSDSRKRAQYDIVYYGYFYKTSSTQDKGNQTHNIASTGWLEDLDYVAISLALLTIALAIPTSGIYKDINVVSVIAFTLSLPIILMILYFIKSCTVDPFLDVFKAAGVDPSLDLFMASGSMDLWDNIKFVASRLGLGIVLGICGAMFFIFKQELQDFIGMLISPLYYIAIFLIIYSVPGILMMLSELIALCVYMIWKKKVFSCTCELLNIE